MQTAVQSVCPPTLTLWHTSPSQHVRALRRYISNLSLSANFNIICVAAMRERERHTQLIMTPVTLPVPLISSVEASHQTLPQDKSHDDVTLMLLLENSIQTLSYRETCQSGNWEIWDDFRGRDLSWRRISKEFTWSADETLDCNSYIWVQAAAIISSLSETLCPSFSVSLYSGTLCSGHFLMLSLLQFDAIWTGLIYLPRFLTLNQKKPKKTSSGCRDCFSPSDSRRSWSWTADVFVKL